MPLSGRVNLWAVSDRVAVGEAVGITGSVGINYENELNIHKLLDKNVTFLSNSL